MRELRGEPGLQMCADTPTSPFASGDHYSTLLFPSPNIPIPTTMGGRTVCGSAYTYVKSDYYCKKSTQAQSLLSLSSLQVIKCPDVYEQ